MCIHHHPTIQQLASQNHRKLKFQTATFPVVAELYVSLFTSRRDASESYTQLMLNVSGNLSYSSLLHRTLQTISHHKSTKTHNSNNSSHFSIHQRGLVANQLLVATDSLTGDASGALEEKTTPLMSKVSRCSKRL
jgi:hypothetical protein